MESIFDITNLSSYKENNSIEAKKAKDSLPNSVWETYSSFANTDGGVILLGVVERADHSLLVQGVTDAHKLVADFWNTIANKQKVSLNILTNRMVYEQTVEDKTILVIEVPRADRSIRPVYIGQDPMTGTYIRFGEGDRLCDRDQVAAFYRDAASSTGDMTSLRGYDMSVFDMQSVRDYRTYFDGKHPGHVWCKQEDKLFLRSIGAIGFDREDGNTYPTLAGLLMFGHEFDIVRECPNYFLDYREVMDPSIRWTHRFVSSSGDWSGNLFDFFFHVYNRLKQAFPIPFSLDKEGARVDDVPMHRALREMITNTLAHADYQGRQGVVIVRRPDSLEFANPGDMRPGLRLALAGGTSDARNTSIMKMFSLLDFGERAGSGIPDVMDICRTELHAEPQYKVSYSPARTAMHIDTGQFPVKNPDKSDLSVKNPDKFPIKQIITDKLLAENKESEKLSVTAATLDKMVEVVDFVGLNPHASTESIAEQCRLEVENAKKYLQRLSALNIVIPEGGNRNRTYVLNPSVQIS